MAYDSTKPANDEYLASFPPEMREQLRAIIEDQIVNAIKLMGLSPGNANGNIPVSNGNLNTNLNAEKHGGKLVSELANATHDHNAVTGSSNGFMSNTDKSKLDGIATGAQVNQNAFGNVLVSGTTIQATAQSSTVEIVPGTNIAIAPDNTNKRVTISVTGKVASATNADTVGGYSPTAFAPSGYGLGVVAVACSDANTAIDTGFYNGHGTNFPTTDRSYNLSVVKSSNGYYTQTATSTGISPLSYFRHCLGGTWSAWKQVATTDSPSFTGIVQFQNTGVPCQYIRSGYKTISIMQSTPGTSKGYGIYNSTDGKYLMFITEDGDVSVPQNNWIKSIDGYNIIRKTNFGFQGSYGVIQIGSPVDSTHAIALGVDVSTNTNGAFYGNEIIIPNVAKFIQPNATNTGYVMDVITINNGTITIGTGASQYGLNVNGTISMNSKTVATTDQIPATSGNTVQLVSATNTNNVTLNIMLPVDATIPQNNEGVQILNASITPKFSTSKLIVEVNIPAGVNAPTTLACALFRDSGTDAISSNYVTCAYGGASMTFLSMRCVVAANSTAATAFYVRCGSGSAINGTINSYMGGTAAPTITVTEILP